MWDFGVIPCLTCRRFKSFLEQLYLLKSFSAYTLQTARFQYVSQIPTLIPLQRNMALNATDAGRFLVVKLGTDVNKATYCSNLEVQLFFS
ncbi:hypothetical protein XELAEV_18018393mg [Xenopus laevis]|uniref:Uncharacterized protein n=1 Tax=Xenopus laevis TaxID=8355 RepID=A0A974HTI2_XENLA|nr:hypothetical protein XELAEV_18018393mg [Xenopus laevis]